MNPRWILIRRLRGPAFLLTFGLTALLHQWGVLSFGQSWPLYLIVAGVLTLLERAALTAPADPNAYPGSYPGAYPASGTPQGWAAPAQNPTSIVPSHPGDNPEGRL